MNEEIKLKDILDIEEMLEENGGELTPEIEAEYDRRHGDDWPKIVASRARIQLVTEMGLKGQRKILTGPWTVSLAKKPPRITLKDGIDLALIEENLLRHIPESWELDKMEVRKSLKSRGLIPTEIGVWEVEDFDVEITERLNIR